MLFAALSSIECVLAQAQATMTAAVFRHFGLNMHSATAGGLTELQGQPLNTLDNHEVHHATLPIRLVLNGGLTSSKHKSSCVTGVAANTSRGHLRCEAGFALIAPLAQVGSSGPCGSSCCNSSLVGGTVLLLLLQTHQLPHFLCSTSQNVRHFIMRKVCSVLHSACNLIPFGGLQLHKQRVALCSLGSPQCGLSS